MNKTALHSMHLAAGARMTPFAGYDMPLQYTGIRAEHLHTRASAGLFDVSHMGQLLISGTGVVKELEYLVPVDLDAMAIGQQRYTFFTLENGGVLDDLIIARTGAESFYLIVNASRKAEDLAHLRQHIKSSVIKVLDDFSLLALQGPLAAKTLINTFAEFEAPGFEALIHSLKFMNAAATALTVAGKTIDIRIGRGGYTGEDGFELSVHNDSAPLIAEKLLANDAVQWIGLGARDSLRLEAGLCLYGHDLSTDTTPVEAGLNWSISPSRRSSGAKAGGFIGAKVILEQLDKGTQRIRHGFLVDGRIPVREGTMITNNEGIACGQVTSGGFSPSLNKSIFMAYVNTLLLDKTLQQNDELLYAVVRDKKIPVVPCKMPFVPKGSALL